MAVPPAARICATNCSAASRELRKFTATRAPSRAKRSAIARPIPVERIIRVAIGPRAIDDIRRYDHLVVNVNWIPGDRVGMGDRDQGVHTIKSLFCDGFVDEWVGIFSDRMPEIRSEGEEEADRIDRAGRDGYKLSVRAGFVAQLKDFLESARRNG